LARCSKVWMSEPVKVLRALIENCCCPQTTLRQVGVTAWTRGSVGPRGSPSTASITMRTLAALSLLPWAARSDTTSSSRATRSMKLKPG